MRAVYVWAVDCFEDRNWTYYCIFRGKPFPIACSKKAHHDTQPYTIDDVGQRIAIFAEMGFSYRNQVHPDADEERLTLFEQLAKASGYEAKRRPLTGNELRRLRHSLGMDELRKVS